MKKLLLLLFTFCCCSFAQAQNTFEKVIDTLGSSGALCIQETFDGGYVYCGQSYFNANDAMIVKLDSIGTIEWVKVYSGPGTESATFIKQTRDSGYMVNAVYNSGLNSRSWLLRLDVNGDTLWTKTFSVGQGATNVSCVNSMASIGDTIYGLTGYYKPIPFTTNNTFFIAYLNNGTLLANKIYNSSNKNNDSRSITNTIDSGFIMAGEIATPSGSADVYLIRTDAYGDTLWIKTFDNSQNDVALAVQQTADSGFIVAGITYNSLVYNIYLIKTNSLGDTLWTKSYYSALTQGAYSVEQTIDGGYIIGGIAIDMLSGNYDVYLVKTDVNGDTLWTKQFGGNMPDNGYFVRQTKDGGYIICGISSSFGNGGTYIIKTDSNGNVLTSSGIAEVNNPFEFTVFPNPSSGAFTIQLNGITSRQSTINVYSITGEQVYSCSTGKNAKEQINLNNLPGGIYAVVLKTKEKMVAKKIIILK